MVRFYYQQAKNECHIYSESADNETTVDAEGTAQLIHSLGEDIDE